MSVFHVSGQFRESTAVTTVLNVIMSRESFDKACQERSVELFEKFVHDNDKKETNELVTEARKQLAHLKKLQRARDQIAKMKRSDLAEIKNLTKPPQPVKDTLTAVMVLLGSSKKDANNWILTKKAFAQMGEESFPNRVGKVSPRSINGKMNDYIKSLVGDVTEESIDAVSRSTTEYLVWVKLVSLEVDEIKKLKKT